METNYIVPVSGNADIYSKNIKECLKGTYRFKETVFQNVCNGDVYTIKAGGWDYFAGLFMASLGICIIVFLVRLTFSRKD